MGKLQFVVLAGGYCPEPLSSLVPPDMVQVEEDSECGLGCG